MFMGRAKYQMDGERNSKYFFSLAKARASNRSIIRLRCDDGHITSQQDQILHMQHQFCNKLYTADKSVRFNITNNTNKKVPVDDRQQLEQPIMLAELQQAVDGFPANKTPGCDGLTAKFYQMFFKNFGSYFHDALLYAYENSKLHISARCGILTLIPKKDRDLLLLKNWRPLTVLTLNCKILSKALNNRLKVCTVPVYYRKLPNWIHGRSVYYGQLAQIVTDNGIC